MIAIKKDLDSLLQGQNAQPHSLLGMHPVTHEGRRGVVVRAFLQDSRACAVVDYQAQPEVRHPMTKVHDMGFYETFIPDRPEVFRYRLQVEKSNGEFRQFYDPYSFLPTLTDQDLYLFNEGTEQRVYQKLGAHLREINGVRGVSFAVWAPNAIRVSVVGEFNRWDGRYLPMRPLGKSGVWEIFVPGLEAGLMYKYEIVPRTGARPGDWIYVTGTLGGSQLGHHWRFTPRLAEGVWLAAGRRWSRRRTTPRPSGMSPTIHGATNSGWRGARKPTG